MKKLEYNIAHRIVAIILAVALVVSVTPLSGLISTRAADTDWTMPDSIILAVKDASNNDEVVANQQILLSGTVEGEEKNFTISTDVNGQAVIDSVNTDANIVDTYNMINTSLQSNGEVKYSVSKAGYVTVESTLSQENINATLSKNTIDIAIKYPVITGVSYTKIEDFVYDELEKQLITSVVYKADENSAGEEIVAATAESTDTAWTAYKFWSGEEEEPDVYSADIPKATEIGNYHIRIKVSKAGYTSFESEIIDVKIEKKDRTGFRFEKENLADVTMAVPDGETQLQASVDNAADNTPNVEGTDEESKDITYSISRKNTDTGEFEILDSSIACVDIKGSVIVKTAGTYKVKAVMAESEHYKESIAEYTFTVLAAVQNGFKFSDSSPISVEINATTAVPLTTEGGATGTTTYEIKNVDDESNTGEIEIVEGTESDAGKYFVKGIKAGTVTIIATNKADNYVDATAESVITVARIAGSASNFSFSATEQIVTYGDIDKSVLELFNTGSGEITYISDNTDIVEISNETDSKGKLVIKAAGTAKITAVRAEDDTYAQSTASYTLTVKKGTQEGFEFIGADTTTPYEVKYKEEGKGLKAEGGEYIDGGTVTYSLKTGSPEDVVSVDAQTGEITVIKPSDTIITIVATKSGNSNYEAVTAEYEVKALKAEQPEFKFVHEYSEKEPLSTIYGHIYTDANTVSGAEEGVTVVYSVADIDIIAGNCIAEINSVTGTITVTGIGVAKVTATAVGNEYYNEATASYYLKAEKSPQTVGGENGFKFNESQPDNIKYKDVYTNTASGGEATGGNVIYSVVENIEIKQANTNGEIVTIDSTTGTITAVGVGKVKIKAVKTGGDFYHDAEAEYVITVDKKEQLSDITFGVTQKSLRFGETYTGAVTGGEDEVAVKYEIISQNPVSSKDTAVIAIDADTGKVTAVGVGSATVKATKGDGFYKDKIAEYTIVVSKTEQTGFGFGFEDGNANVDVNYGNKTTSRAATGGQSIGNITYSISALEGYAGTPTVDNSGKVTLTDYAVGKIEITAVKAGDTHYNATSSKYTVTVKSNGKPVADGRAYTLSGEKTGESYKDKVEINAAEGYTLSESNSLYADFTESITLTNDGVNPEFNIYLKKNGTNEITEAYIVNEIKVDAKKPDKVKITYSESLKDKILSGFGFSNKAVMVTLESKDSATPIEKFEYSYGDIKNQIIGKSDITYAADGTAKAVFTIEPQFRGNVSAIAYDSVGHDSDENTDNKVVIVDSIKPGINTNLVDGKLYNKDVAAVVAIKESNFFEEDVNIKVTRKTVSSSTVQDITSEVIEKWKDGSEADIHNMNMSFTKDGYYTVNISAKDKSDNEADTYTVSFAIDKTAPAVSVTYDNNNAKDNTYYKASRTAEITVTDQSFDPSKMDFDLISVVDVQGNTVDITDYNAYLKKVSSWTNDGSKHIAYITFNTDATYDFNVSVTDLAGFKSNVVHDSFTIDKTTPSDVSISYSKPVLMKVIEKVTFGYYKAPVKVTLKADDNTSGIEKFVYSYTGSSENVVTISDIKYSNNGKTAETSFEIPAEFNGNVTARAVDKSGLVSSTKTDTSNTLVVDDIKPVVNVVYDRTPSEIILNNKYYNDNTKAVITVDEVNFYAEDIDVTVKRRLNSENVFTDVSKEYSDLIKNSDNWSKQSGDIYTTSLLFDTEADYMFTISYTDRSGNEYNSYATDEFTIDKTDPVVNISYDNNQARNGNQFKADRVATISVTEHNFKAEDVSINIGSDALVVAKDNMGNDVAVADYVSYLKDRNNWIDNGDIHVANISFTEEANYTFEYVYTDLVGRTSGSDYGISTAPTLFTIDKTAPTGDITIGNWSSSLNGSIWNQYLSTMSFSLYSSEAVDVTINSADALSNIEAVQYYRTSEILTEGQLKNIAQELWVTSQNGNIEFTVEPDEQFVVYAHVIDRAGNEIYISSDGVVVDKTAPLTTRHAAEIAINPEQPINGIYNSDVKVDVTVEDPITNGIVYSGIKTVSYNVYNMGESTQEGVLYSQEDGEHSKAQLVHNWSQDGCIVIDSELNNSNNVEVEVTVIDNSGNQTSNVISVKIDRTAPIINVSYDNNNGDTSFGEQIFFKEERTATIAITERNFNADQVVMTIENTDGTAPIISDWSIQEGTGNGDDTVHTVTVNYYADGDYTFDISFSDEAGNVNEEVRYDDSLAPKEFTVDMTVPEIEVQYDNNNAANNNYYNQTRVGTVTIREHNFDESRVQADITATNNGADSAAPSLSGWSTSGDVHTATITYAGDLLYSFAIKYTDQAGNEAAEYPLESFYVDESEPEITISGVENTFAYSGNVAPVVSFNDTNFDAGNSNVTLIGSSRGRVDFDGTVESTDNGVQYVFNNFPNEESVDDIYTLTASSTDMAGNSKEETISFSVNRFGSTYTFSDATNSINGSYINSPENIVVYEVNVDALSEISITVFKNNETILLTEGSDYSVQLEGGNGQWYRYTYTIFKNVFDDDGVYRIAVHSVDTAGNVADNTIDTKSKEISFGVDKTTPNIILANLEDGTTYPTDNLRVDMVIEDNLKMGNVKVYLDNSEIKSWNQDEIAQMITKGEDYTFDISGDSTEAHYVRVVAHDAAGNQSVSEVNNFFVTTNKWIQFVNNKALFYGSIAGATVVSAGGATGITFMIRRKKRII